ncbi:MAG: hypothetical protein A3G81_26485 [Betaproteobacteria bacterium RIFCSPLOWO2_12_FULL_65_14]|nr:MAG: hypothetical protein A3G81_26485 [Betaproteobacteria bacterium RIFCSPLOWO2_12_FULL_65_14]
MRTSAWCTIATAFGVLAGCGTLEPPSGPQPPERRIAPERRVLKSAAQSARLIPARVSDRNGWAEDLQAAMAALEIEPNGQNVCAVLAVLEQESDFRVDPVVPGLSRIARLEIEKRREQAGVPKFMVDAALKLASSNGRSYGEELAAAKTERQLSDLFEDFAGRVPLGKRLFADFNPVRSAGPMQVSVSFAQAYAQSKRYPFGMSGSVRQEVFTRRGGIYFGIAHLLDYPAPYDDLAYRFADFNAGRHASRNAAFQKAVGALTGVEVPLDGDLLRYEQGRPLREASRTELATRRLAVHFEMTPADVRRDLELAHTAEFERSRLYLSVFTLQDGVLGKPAPRAVLPSIVVDTSKTTRRLTTESYAARVGGRYRNCLARL